MSPGYQSKWGTRNVTFRGFQELVPDYAYKSLEDEVHSPYHPLFQDLDNFLEVHSERPDTSFVPSPNNAVGDSHPTSPSEDLRLYSSQMIHMESPKTGYGKITA